MIRIADTVSRVDARSGSGSRQGVRGSGGFVLARDSDALPESRAQRGVGQDGRGLAWMCEKDGAGWLGRWLEDVPGADRMNAPRNGAVIASGQGGLR